MRYDPAKGLHYDTDTGDPEYMASFVRYWKARGCVVPMLIQRTFELLHDHRRIKNLLGKAERVHLAWQQIGHAIEAARRAEPQFYTVVFRIRDQIEAQYDIVIRQCIDKWHDERIAAQARAKSPKTQLAAAAKSLKELRRLRLYENLRPLTDRHVAEHWLYWEDVRNQSARAARPQCA